MFDKDFFNKDVSEYTLDEIQEMKDALERIYSEVPEYYTVEAILKRMLSNVPNDIDKRQGSIIYDALMPCAGEIAQEYIEIQIYKDQTYLMTAVGDNLDKIGASYTILREPATYAKRLGEFRDNSNNYINLPIGSRFAVPNSSITITYAVKSYESAGIPVLECEQAGIIGNEYFGDILPLFPIDNLKIAKLTGTKVPAQDENDDETYRAKIISKLNTKSFGGNIADYKDYIDNIAGTSEPKVFPVWNGGGTVKVSVLDSQYNAISNEFKAEIKEIIDPIAYTGQGVGIAPIGHTVTIDTPTEVEINITATVQLDSVTLGQITSSAEENLENYMLSIRKSWATNDSIGVYISQVIAAILSVQGVENVTDVTINGEDEDLILTSTATTQYIPVLGEVTLNEQE